VNEARSAAPVEAASHTGRDEARSLCVPADSLITADSKAGIPIFVMKDKRRL
jgi:hypothetical protein